MYKAIEFQVEGFSPLVLHNGRGANPIDPLTIQLAEVTSKRKKTAVDYETIARLEWECGLYLDKEGRPCLPGECIEAFFKDAAKAKRMGKSAAGAIVCDGDWPIIYKGPRDIEKLWADTSFRIVKRMRIKQAAVIRTLPMFDPWSVTFVLHYFPEVFSEKQVVQFVTSGGRFNGWFEFRPKYGRFDVKSYKALD